MSEQSDREILLEMRGDLKEVMRQATATNGRVTALEGRERARELREAEERGRRLAAPGITWKQIGGLGTFVTVLAGIAGTVARYL